MKLRVLGSYGGDIQGRFPAFLVNDSVLADAGTIGSALTHAEQLRIRAILLTHHHIDHMLGIPFFADAVFGHLPEPVDIYAPESVIRHLRTHLLNDILWPDFTRLPDADTPTLRCHPTDPAATTALPGGLAFHIVPTCHIGPSCGYIITEGNTGLVYTGDTGVCEPFWTALSRFRERNPDIVIRAIIIECSFPDNRESFARSTRHLTPGLLRDELTRFSGDCPDLMIFHMKPTHIAEIEAEIRSLLGERVKLLIPDDEYDITQDGIRLLKAGIRPDS